MNYSEFTKKNRLQPGWVCSIHFTPLSATHQHFLPGDLKLSGWKLTSLMLFSVCFWEFSYVKTKISQLCPFGLDSRSKPPEPSAGPQRNTLHPHMGRSAKLLVKVNPVLTHSSRLQPDKPGASQTTRPVSGTFWINLVQPKTIGGPMLPKIKNKTTIHCAGKKQWRY